MDNKKKTIYIAAAVVIVLALVVLAGIFITRSRGEAQGESGTPADQGTSQPQEELTQDKTQAGTPQDAAESGQAAETTALYIPIKDDVYLLIDQENGTVFTATFPEEMYGLNGEKITQKQLEKGNILKIYGNGIMLESYPGQYPGVSKIEVIEKGDPSDADAYQDIVDQVYSEPDPAEPPVLNVEYTTEMAAVSSVVERGGYEWTYLDTDGTSNSVVADVEPVLLWGDQALNPVKLAEPLDMTLNFSEQPEEIIVERWPAELRNPGGETPDGEIPDGEPVEVAQKDGKPVLTGVEPGYVYKITGVWQYGRAEFGFLTVS